MISLKAKGKQALQPLKRAAARMAYAGSVLASRLPGQLWLTERRMKYDRYALIVAHDRYVKAAGGTQKSVYEQVAWLASNRIGAIVIYPFRPYAFLGTAPAYYGLLLDGAFRGCFGVAQLRDWLVANRERLALFYTHHLLYWQYTDYMTLARSMAAQGLRPVVVLHDFFTLCSSYHLMFEAGQAGESRDFGTRRSCVADIVAAASPAAAICRSCRHSAELAEWRAAARSVLELADQIIAPSEFVRSTVSAIHKDIGPKISIHPHLKRVRPRAAHKPRPEGKLRLAFLGHSTELKGRAIWERLCGDASLRLHYQFHHIGSREPATDHVAKHRYSFVREGRMAATDLLLRHDIDLVLLWSLAPESYSYTLQEAIAAGARVLTSPRSGNIALTLLAHPEWGRVLADEEALLALLRDPETVKDWIAGPRTRYELEYNALPSEKEG